MLKYILIGKLPKTERDMLLENLRTERECGRNVLEWDSAKKHIQEEKRVEGALAKERLAEKVFAEKAILVSGDAKELNEAQRIGMAVLCYLMPGDGRTQRNEAAAGEMEVTSPADMYAEGMEEIDGSFLQHVYERHHRIPWIILKTPRCIVKEFSMEYLDALFELYAGKGMTDYMEPLYPYEEEREYQQAYIEQMYRFYGYGMWIVCDRNTGELIGRAGVEHREELGGARLCDRCAVAETGLCDGGMQCDSYLCKGGTHAAVGQLSDRGGERSIGASGAKAGLSLL